MLKLRIGDFLTERKIRYKPSEANHLGFLRIEKIDFNGNIHLVENKPTKTDMILVKPYDLVISGINVQKGALGIYSGNSNALATIHYSSYEYDENIIDLDYFKYFLRSSKFIHELESQTGSGIKTELKPKKFLTLNIELPSIDKQKQIAYLIRSSSTQLDKLNIKIAEQEILLKKLYDSILQDAISGKLVPQNSHDESAVVLLEKIQSEKIKLINEGKLKKEKPLPKISSKEIPFDLPHGWVWARMGEVVNYSQNKTILPDSIKENTWILELEDIEKDTCKLSRKIYSNERKPNSSRVLFKPNNVLYGKLRPYLNKAIIANDYGCCSSEIIPIELFANTNPKFIQYMLVSKYFSEYATKCSFGTKMPRLGTEDAINAIIPIPPLQEQKLIVNKIECLLKKYFQLKENMNLIKINANNLLQSVLNEYF